MRNEVKTRDNLLETLYLGLESGSLDDTYLPHSETYYVREALLTRTGVLYPLPVVEKAIKLHRQRFPDDISQETH